MSHVTQRNESCHTNKHSKLTANTCADFPFFDATRLTDAGKNLVMYCSSPLLWMNHVRIHANESRQIYERVGHVNHIRWHGRHVNEWRRVNEIRWHVWHVRRIFPPITGGRTQLVSLHRPYIVRFFYRSLFAWFIRLFSVLFWILLTCHGRQLQLRLRVNGSTHSPRGVL